MLESLDLLPLQTVLSITGALLAIYAMQLPHSRPYGELWPARLVRRFGVALVAGGMLWSVRYAMYQGWQPWPPYILILIGINLALLAAIISDSTRPATSQDGA
jgi:predicted acyltransferase